MIRSIAIAVVMTVSVSACANVKFAEPEARHETADTHMDREARKTRAENERIVRCQSMDQKGRDRSGDCR